MHICAWMCKYLKRVLRVCRSNVHDFDSIRFSIKAGLGCKGTDQPFHHWSDELCGKAKWNVPGLVDKSTISPNYAKLWLGNPRHMVSWSLTETELGLVERASWSLAPSAPRCCLGGHPATSRQGLWWREAADIERIWILASALAGLCGVSRAHTERPFPVQAQAKEWGHCYFLQKLQMPSAVVKI